MLFNVALPMVMSLRNSIANCGVSAKSIITLRWCPWRLTPIWFLVHRIPHYYLYSKDLSGLLLGLYTPQIRVPIPRIEQLPRRQMGH